MVGPLSKSDEYQRKAEECQRMADATSSDEQKRSWMSLAEGWLRMVTPTAKKQSAEQKFDAAVRDKGTHQRWSDKEN